MLYLSTRGHAERKHFCDILLEGLAPDGGLYLPEHYPQVDDALLTRLRAAYRDQGYAELAFQILQLFIDDIPAGLGADHAGVQRFEQREVFLDRHRQFGGAQRIKEVNKHVFGLQRLWSVRVQL